MLIGGILPDTSVYTLTLRLPNETVSGFKLEALTHDSLPGNGPGRGDAERTNFVLNEIELFYHGKRRPKPVTLVDAKANFSQQNWPVAGAIDGNRKTGWAIAPQFHKPHWASFRLRDPLEASAQGQLVVHLVQNYGRGRTLGRIRVSALIGNAKGVDLPENIVAILKSKQRKPKQQQQLDAYLAESNPRLKQIDRQIAAVKKAHRRFATADDACDGRTRSAAQDACTDSR